MKTQENKFDEIMKENWGKLSLLELSELLSLDKNDILKMAFRLNLQKIKTPEIKRRWTAEEDLFLVEHANLLTIPEACNLLYRSRYATYQRVKFLNL